MELKEAIARIYKEMKGRLDIQNQPTVFLNHDEENSKDIFGRTAYYSPQDQSIVLYITNRHPKDICRSFAHELIHHHQNERGDLDLGDATSPNYAQEDGHMRKMEMEAYLKGNMLFRDFEDNYKKSIREFTGTGASGGNSTDGNDITSPRPFADDEDEKENYMNKNVYGGSGGHYKREPATTGFNRTKFTKFEESMKKSDIYELIKESIKEIIDEIGADAYGSATLTSQGQSKSRFTKTGRPPGIMENNPLTSDMLNYADQYHMELVDSMESVSTFVDKRTGGTYFKFPHYNGPGSGVQFGKDVVNRINIDKSKAKSAAQKLVSQFQNNIEDYEITDVSPSGVYGSVYLWIMFKNNINEEDALVTRGKKIIQILNKPEYKSKKATFDDFIRKRTNGQFGLPNKINDKTDGDILALLNLRAKDFSNIFK